MEPDVHHDPTWLGPATGAFALALTIAALWVIFGEAPSPQDIPPMDFGTP